MRRRAGIGLVVLAATVAGCGGKTTDEDRAADQVRSFVQAGVGNDGASVCAALTPSSQRSVRRLAAAQGQPDLACSRLVVRQLQLAGLGERSADGLRVARRDATHFVAHAKALEADPATGVRVTDENGIYRITLVDVAGVRQVLKAGRRCAAARREVLSLPLPPSDHSAWPAYLERAARRARRAAALGVEDAAALRTTARRLRSLAGAIRSGGSAKAMRRAIRVLRELDLDAAGLTVPQADCGENPRRVSAALEYQGRVSPFCAASRAASGATAVARQNKAAQAAFKAHVRALGAFARAAARGPLPKVLDTVRDGLVADLRRGRRVASGQLAAIRSRNLSAFFAQGADTDPGALAGRLQLALSRLDISC